MTQLLSFHNNPKIKARYVERLKAHAKADEFIKGQYWQNGKGCAVGCTIHSSNHNAYETELGLPEWLARLEDAIFEGLDNGHAKLFAIDFLLAIPIGINLEPVKWKFCAFILKENIDRTLTLTLDAKLKQRVVDSIQACLKLQEDAIRTGKWDKSVAESAARSAESAAESAESAWSAAWSAAESAWSAAWSAAESAWSAAESARSAARSAESAARSVAYEKYAKELIRLLKAEGR